MPIQRNNGARAFGQCDYCGKPLNRQPCCLCGGLGTIRKFLLFKVDCHVCSGNGHVEYCTDDMQHFQDLIQVHSRPAIRWNKTPPSSRGICPTCNGRGWVYDYNRFHQLAPFIGSPGRIPCPTCGGGKRS